jgi:predicted transport protein
LWRLPNIPSGSLAGVRRALYHLLRKRILNIDLSVKEEFKKLYLAFKSGTNFVDIVPQKARLRLSLNMAFNKINDPKGICKDITDLGRWGNGDIEVGISSSSQLDDVMGLIQQAFESQMELGE